jgi:hypothetical protein
MRIFNNFKKYLLVILTFIPKTLGFSFIPPDMFHTIAINMVKTTTSILPAADSIGHHILHTNEILIHNLLDNEEISMEIKKPIILNLIKAAQTGDQVGGEILKNYEILVDKLL